MLQRLIARMRGLVSRRSAASELDEELRFHVEQETAANVQRGLSPADARRVAMRDLGGLAQTREAVHEVRASRLDSILREM